jgi:hypothetical protein
VLLPIRLTLSFMGKSDVLWSTVAGAILLLIVGNLVSQAINPINVQSETFECKANECTLRFELHNDSHHAQTGVVTVHYRENSNFATAKGVGVFRTIKKPFEIDALGSVSYSDSFSTKREGVLFFFAISTH